MLSTVDPRQHDCQLEELDYSAVAEGFIRCTVCPRQWNLHHFADGGTCWINSCPVRMPNEHGPHFWTSDLKPYPPPTTEEIIANRALRQEMIDKKEKERIESIKAEQAGLTWLQSQRGGEAKVGGEWWAEQLRAGHMVTEPDDPPTKRVKLAICFPTARAAIRFVRRIS